MSDQGEGKGLPEESADDGARGPRGRDGHASVLDRLSDHLDGELDGASRAEVEAHLAVCDECRATLEDLRRVVAAARGLPERSPRHDLWPGIAARLVPRPGAGEARRPRVEGRGGHPGRRTRRRLELTVPQLAAAAVLLVALTSSATWWAGTRGGPLDGSYGTGVLQPGGVARAGSTGSVRSAAMPEGAAGVPEPMAEELAVLEAVLDSGRTVLDPNTVLVLERNLAVIERAIADSRGALALDPGSDFLAGHLERAYERKLEYLRDVSRIVELAG